MLLADRDPDREVRHLRWRVRLFGAGAVVGLVGIYLDASWVVWAAVAILVLGFGLRFLPEKPEKEDPEKEDDGG